MKYIVYLFCLVFVLNCIGCTSTPKESNSAQSDVPMSEAQRNTDFYMNTSSDILKAAYALKMVCPQDSFNIYMEHWDDVPIDTVYTYELCDMMLSPLEWRYKSLSEEMKRYEANMGTNYDSSYIDSKLGKGMAAFYERKLDELDSIYNLKEYYESLSFYNGAEPVVYVYKFTEHLRRYYSISKEYGDQTYDCYSYVYVHNNQVAKVDEAPKKYEKKRLGLELPE